MSVKDKRYTVTIGNRAAKMLADHARFLEQVNSEASARLYDEFIKKAKSLEIMPARCSYIEHIAVPTHKYRKLIFEKNYALVFLIEENTVYVDAVVDCRQDYGWLL